jgi:acyl carrier protein
MLDEKLMKQVIATVLQVDPSTIGPDSSSDTIESWDSLKHMNLVLALEEEFNVTIPDEEAANITSYKLIKLVLEELLQEA